MLSNGRTSFKNYNFDLFVHLLEEEKLSLIKEDELKSEPEEVTKSNDENGDDEKDEKKEDESVGKTGGKVLKRELQRSLSYGTPSTENKPTKVKIKQSMSVNPSAMKEARTAKCKSKMIFILSC